MCISFPDTLPIAAFSVFHEQELREKKCAQEVRGRSEGKGKKDKTETEGGDRHPEARLLLRVIRCCPC